LWVARRAKDKPTYPGLLDQVRFHAHYNGIPSEPFE
jgi:hypothetical protein